MTAEHVEADWIADEAPILSNAGREAGNGRGTIGGTCCNTTKPLNVRKRPSVVFFSAPSASVRRWCAVIATGDKFIAVANARRKHDAAVNGRLAPGIRQAIEDASCTLNAAGAIGPDSTT